MGEELVLWRQVAINALDAYAEFVGSVGGQLPSLVGRVHFVAGRAAEFAFRRGAEHCVDGKKGRDGA